MRLPNRLFNVINVINVNNAKPAKLFYVGCGLAGMQRGWSQSKYNRDNRERLYIDRIAWSVLYGGIYTFGYPFVVYYALQELEMKIRKIKNYPNVLEALDTPHLQNYELPDMNINLDIFEDSLSCMTQEELLKKINSLTI